MHRRSLAATSLFPLLLLMPALIAQGELVIVKERTGLYHRAGCAAIRDATDVLAMGVGQAEARGFKAHADCDPSKAQPSPATPRPPASSAKPATVFVFVDTMGKLYHREACRRLGKDQKRIMLDAATAKRYWPCGVCKPPIRPRVKK